MIKPFKGDYPMTRGFASSIRLANDAKYGSHKGVDWALPVGTKLYAAKSGRVTWAQDAGDAGLTVTIESGNLLIKCFHMSEIAVKHNQQVKEGDFIGLSGNSGNTTGPHLHMQVESFQIPVDPLPLITGEPKEEKVEKVNKGDINNFCLFLLGRAPTKEDYARVGTSWKETAEAYMMGNEFVGRIKQLSDRSAAAAELEKARDKFDYPLIENLKQQLAKKGEDKEQLNRMENMLKQLTENK